MVHLRDPADLTPNYPFPETVASTGVWYRAVNPAVATIFSGLSFNPGLRRMRDYRIAGPYAGLWSPSNERYVADFCWQLGFLLACLAEPAVRHIGYGRHVRDQAKPPDFASRLNRSVRKRWLGLRRKPRPGERPDCPGQAAHGAGGAHLPAVRGLRRVSGAGRRRTYIRPHFTGELRRWTFWTLIPCSVSQG